MQDPNRNNAVSSNGDDPKVRHYCNICMLVFKSKQYLINHLSMEHNLDVESSTRDSGLKRSEPRKADASSSGWDSGFKSSMGENFREHTKQCEQNNDLDLMEETMKPSNISQDEEADEIPAIVSVFSLSSSFPKYKTCKDMKTYKRPSETPAKDSTRKSTSIGNPNTTVIDLTDDEPQILEKYPVNSGRKTAAFQLAGSSQIDISQHISKQLLHDPRMISKYQAISTGKQPVFNPAKRTMEGENPNCAKKPKNKTTEKKEFTFEVSDEENEVCVKKPSVYNCKHCHFNDENFSELSLHYRSHHPFVKCKVNYIHNTFDLSMTFRCLVCPVEFPGEIDLKWHHQKYHPAAPDIFKMKTNELDFIYKCFQCPFIAGDVKELRKHYTTEHPTFDASNSLLFYPYLFTESQVDKDPVNSEPEKSMQPSPDEVQTSMKENKNPSLSLNVPDMTLLQCGKCKFSHQSVVVMRIHYKNKHPNEAESLTQIKQLTQIFSSSVTPGIPEEKVKHKVQETQQKKLPSAAEHKPEASTICSASLETEAVADESETSAKKHNEGNEAAGSPSSPEKLMSCQFCNFTSTSIESFDRHYYDKHSSFISVADKATYSTEVHEKNQAAPNSGQQATVQKPDKTRHEAQSTSVTTSFAYLNAEDLFYCQECNYGDKSVSGVVDHQKKAHKQVTELSDAIVQYTALVRDEIIRFKSLHNSSSSFSHLPLPFLNKGDEKRYFCPLCNFRHNFLFKVMRHCSQAHRGVTSKANVLEYTSKVLVQAGKSPVKPVQNQAEKPKNTKNVKKTKVNRRISFSFNPPESHKTFQCYKCNFQAKNLFLIKTHLRFFHSSYNQSMFDILQFYFQQGVLESGYYCHWCDFHRDEAELLLNHIESHHPMYTISLEGVRSGFYVGPDSPKTMDSGDVATATSPCSIESDGNFCPEPDRQPAQPELQKSDEDQNTCAQSQLDDRNNASSLFESFQCPLEDLSDLVSPSTTFMCLLCRAEFHTEQDLSRHIEILHRSQEEQERLKKMQTLVHAFKCPHCTFISTSYHGISIHSRRKHANMTSIVKSIQVKMPSHSKIVTKVNSGIFFKFSGFQCDRCLEICTSPAELTKHNKRRHNEPEPSTVREMPEETNTTKVAKAQESDQKALIQPDEASNGMKASGSKSKEHLEPEEENVSARMDTTEESGMENYAQSTSDPAQSISDPNPFGSALAQSIFDPNPFGSAKAQSTFDPNSFGSAPAQSIFDPGQSFSEPGPFSSDLGPFGSGPAQFISDPGQFSFEPRPFGPDPGLSYSALDPSSSDAPQKMLYQCPRCGYRSQNQICPCCQYSRDHKQDTLSAYRQMEYNKKKCNCLSQCGGLDPQTLVQCKICSKQNFDPSQSLVGHYTTHNSSVSNEDFFVVSPGLMWECAKFYKCVHYPTVLCGAEIPHSHSDHHKPWVVEEAAKTERDAPPDCSLSEPASTQDETLSRQNEASGENFASPPEPPPPQVIDKAETEEKTAEHVCKYCKSVKSLHSHENDHRPAKLNDTIILLQSIYKYIIQKPKLKNCFYCACCDYQTDLLNVWTSHFLKNHLDILLVDYPELIHQIEEIRSTLPDATGDDDVRDTSAYAEPPNVQRQLDSRKPMASAQPDPLGSNVPDDNLLHCELCDFKREKLSSIRRHYTSRHRTKLLKCKDCSFFTGVQRNLDLHMKMGHKTCQSQPTHQKDFCCPFCLYQTRSMDDMIDHVALHRGEAHAVPPAPPVHPTSFHSPAERVDLHRPHLSHYHKGRVFHCHRCSFYCGSANGLRLHVAKHGSTKPCECRLCYFDCAEPSQLEEHLNEKHQVIRNHELVGQVSLDELEARKNISDGLSNNTHFTDGNEVEAETKSKATQTQLMAEQHKGNLHTTLISDTRSKSTTNCSSVPEMQLPQIQREETGVLQNKNAKEGENPEAAETQKLKTEHETDHLRFFRNPARNQDLDAKVEDEILDQILQLDRESSPPRVHYSGGPNLTDDENLITKEPIPSRHREETDSASSHPKPRLTFKRQTLTLPPDAWLQLNPPSDFTSWKQTKSQQEPKHESENPTPTK